MADLEEFPIINVPTEASEEYESMGTKPKFWYHDGGERWLFKEGRPGTGENWAEKMASELAELLGLPHARYELALWGSKPGTASLYFLPPNGELIHGNELLKSSVPDYPKTEESGRRFFRVPQHNLKNVWEVLQNEDPLVPFGWDPPQAIEKAVDVFVGYLLLDAWIGNTDRHHANWGLVRVLREQTASEAAIYLAPTFDHASSLGRELKDDVRRNRMDTKDRGYSVDAYASRSRSAFYSDQERTRPLTNTEAFREAAAREPKAAGIWIERLSSIGENDTMALLGRMPRGWMSEVSAQFVNGLLSANRGRLVAERERLR